MITKQHLLPSVRSTGLGRHRRQREAMDSTASLYYNYPEPPAQRQAEILGTPTHAQLTSILTTDTMHIGRH